MPEVVGLGFLAGGGGECVGRGCVGVAVAVEGQFSGELEEVAGRAAQGPGFSCRLAVEGVVERGELVADERVHGALGAGELIDLPQVAVHAQEVLRHPTAGPVGEGGAVVGGQGHKGAGDGYGAQKLASDHVVEVP
jgi:hypothetical protein